MWVLFQLLAVVVVVADSVVAAALVVVAKVVAAAVEGAPIVDGVVVGATDATEDA